MEFPDLGLHCSKVDCGQLDFLPFTCHGCRLVFCLDHRSYQGHNCPQAKRTTTCPLCQLPVACGTGDNVDRAMDVHIANGCKSAAGKRRKKKRCSVRSCRKVELVPLICSACGLQFCIGHRLPHDHACIPTQKKVDSRASPLPGPNSQPPHPTSPPLPLALSR